MLKRCNVKGGTLVEKHKIERINELSKIKRQRTLTDAEANEQKALRMEYISEMRSNVRHMMDNTVIKRPDGSVEHVKDRLNDTAGTDAAGTAE